MKTIYLVRHCSANGQSSNATLTSSGIQQAQALVSFFNMISIEHIISSPYVRAQQSISPTALSKQLIIQTDSRLAERILSDTDLPDWMTQLKQTFTDLDLKLSGGESSHEATARGVEVITEVPNHSLIVTHGNLMTLLLKHFDDSYGFHEWKSLSNPDVYKLTFNHSISNIQRVWSQKSNTID